MIVIEVGDAYCWEGLKFDVKPVVKVYANIVIPCIFNSVHTLLYTIKINNIRLVIYQV